MEEIIRCACYTRKSVEDATLDRDFNSLTSQREACESYIASQKCRGWVCLPERYDDGGFSGGNMNRPAMTRLKADIEAGKIDMVVCYKIDRLSRSIIDFAELQKFFEEHNVHFVSVTQDINTSNSSGRMLLNILITFAAFERDLIIDRVKTAIDGGKKRGKFCGGVPMMGYRSDPLTKKLQIDEEEAKTVRIIFEKYLALESLKQTVHEVNRLGLTSRAWTSASTGKLHEAKKWTTASIHRVLSNPIYAGYVRHYDSIYEGEHKAIIPRSEWEKVQALMNSHGRNRRGCYRKQYHAFDGLVRCGHCRCALTPTYAKRHGKKYYYYICQKTIKDPDHTCPLSRIPEGNLEQAVLGQLAALFRAPAILRATLAAVRSKEELLRRDFERDCEILQNQLKELKKASLEKETDYEEIKKVASELAEVKRKKSLLLDVVSEETVIAALSDVSGLWDFMFPATRTELLRLIISNIEVFSDKISLTLKVEGLKNLAEEMAVSGYFHSEHTASEKLPETQQTVLSDGSIRLTMKLETKKINGHRHVVIPAPGAERLKQTSLLRAIRNAQKWLAMLMNGEAKNLTDLASQLGLKPSYVSRILSLNNLAPDIVEAIVEGNEPDGLSIEKISRNIPEDWAEQRKLFGFPAL